MFLLWTTHCTHRRLWVWCSVLTESTGKKILQPPEVRGRNVQAGMWGNRHLRRESKAVGISCVWICKDFTPRGFSRVLLHFQGLMGRRRSEVLKNDRWAQLRNTRENTFRREGKHCKWACSWDWGRKFRSDEDYRPSSLDPQMTTKTTSSGGLCIL